MKFYTFFYGLSIVIGLSGALPIPSVGIGVGERNMYLIGAVAFFSFGAILAGCVCCRRRKKGFEEFTNESGTLESNKTEYPIFRALSPETQQKVNESNDSSSTSIIIEDGGTNQNSSIQPSRSRNEQNDPVQSAVVISIPVVNSSNERLITNDDNDNNNGPISSADLENIENNNAVDYIRNQNEIGIITESSSSSLHSRNRNLDIIPSSESNLEQRITILEDNNINEINEQKNDQLNTSLNDIKIEIEETTIIKTEVPIEYSQIINLNKHSNKQSSAENNALQDFAITSSTDFIDNFSTKQNSMLQNQIKINDAIVESQNLHQNDIFINNKSYNTDTLNLNQNIQNINEIKTLHSNSSLLPLECKINIDNNSSTTITTTAVTSFNNDFNNSNDNESINKIRQHIVQETVPISLFIDNSSKLINHKNQHNQYNDNHYHYHQQQNNPDSGNNLEYKTIESMTENFNDNILDEKNKSKFGHIKNENLLMNDESIDEISVTQILTNDMQARLKEETCSIESDSSEKSNETGSVEEALRALDIAIGDDPVSENCSGGEEDDNLDNKTVYIEKEINDEETISYENVIRDLLVTKGMGLNGLITPKQFNIPTENTSEETEIITKYEETNDFDLQEKIKSDALELVESILDESRKIVEQKTQISSLDLNTEAKTNQNYIVNYALIQHQNPIIQMNGQVIVPEDEKNYEYNDINENLNKKTENLNSFSSVGSNLKKLKSVESLECLFESEFLPSTSTPCVQNKFQNKNTYESTTNTNNGIKLFECDNRELQTDEQNSMELFLDNSLDKFSEESNKNSPITDVTYNANANDKTYNANATFNANETYNAIDALKPNETFEINNKTYDAIPDKTVTVLENDFTYPGDPCSSKQAIERDQFLKPLIKYQREEITSEELNTITPVNTPIELNYNQETWDKMTKTTEESDYPRSGWFLHPQEMISGNIGDENVILITDKPTFDLACEGQEAEEEEEEEDAEKLELTFDMLRKQLAEVLPQPQSVVGPPDFSDDDDEQQGGNRTFDEYRSPLDGFIGLLENEIEPPSSVAANEVFINYKRTLSPILEESETEETCKTFVMNETKCLDSTSTGCVETGEAIMGVCKALMASNDTLFNFEDTLGDKEDCSASPRLSSQSDSQATTPVKGIDNRSTASSIATTITTSSDTEKGVDNKYLNEYTIVIPDRRTPPKTLAFATDIQHDTNRSDAVNDFCSPVEQKTFSDGTTSTSTDRVSSDISPTLDNETTFTMNTIDDKTCVTVIIKDDERISEISEPEWGSTASFNICDTNNIQCVDGGDTFACDMNSLTDVPSLDFNVNSFDKEFDAIGNNETDNSHSEESVSDCLDQNKPIVIEAINGPLIIISAPNDKTSLDDETTTESSNCLDDINNQEETANKIDSGHDDSGHSTQLSLDDKSNNTSHNISAQETDSIGDSPYNPQQQQQIHQKQSPQLQQEQNYQQKEYPVNDTESTNKYNCKEFLQKEIEFSSSSQNLKSKINNSNTNEILENGYIDSVPLHTSPSDDDIFLLDHSKENSDPNIKKLYNDSSIIGTNITDHHNYQNTLHHHHNHHHMDRTKDNRLIGNSVGGIAVTGGIGVYSNKVQISNGHQDAVIKMDKNIDISEHETTNNVYVETLHDIRFTGPGNADMLSTSFTTASNSTSEWDSDVDDSHSSEEFMYVRGPSANAEILRYIKQESYSNDDEKDSDLWISNTNDKQSKEKFKVGSADDDLVSEASSSEYEGEFVPSSWDSMAQPSRSALKSPDKNNSNSNDNKKRRNVVFKKQRYHSVYEYPRENLSLSPAYSEPILNSHKGYYTFSDKSSLEEFDDGFIVSSSMRPFHGGSQFNACYTWPTDSDFSWSQVDDIDNYNTEQSLATYNEIKWTHPMSLINNQSSNDIIDLPNKIEENRPDSGVGESAEMLSDRQSLGELCHTKTKLRLPIEGLTTTAICNDFSTTAMMTAELNNEKNYLQQINIPTTTIKPTFNSKDDDEPISKFIPENIITTQKDIIDIENKNKMNFSTFGKRDSINNDEISFQTNICLNDKQNNKRIAPKTILKYRQIKPAINIILIDDISGQQQHQQQQQQQPSSADIYYENSNSNNSSNSSNESNPFDFKQNKNIIVNNCERNNIISNVNNEINNELILKSEKIRQSDSTDEDSGIESIMKLNNRIESD